MEIGPLGVGLITLAGTLLAAVLLRAGWRPTRDRLPPPAAGGALPPSRQVAPAGRSTCFACGAAVSADRPAGQLSRFACGACKGHARLAAGGARLSDVLRSGRPYPLEGNILSFVLNPVLIDGRRGWADFAGGGWAVLEEVLPSADPFDYFVQHCEPGPSILRAVRAAGLAPSADLQSLRAVVAGIPSQPLREGADVWLASIWDSMRTGAAVVADRAPILSNEQAWEAAEAWPAERVSSSPADERALVERVVLLAAGPANKPGRGTTAR